MWELLRPAVYAGTPLTTAWATPLFRFRGDGRVFPVLLRRRGDYLVSKGIWTRNYYREPHAYEGGD